MTSIIRSTVNAGATLALVVGLSVGATGLVDPAGASTTPTPSTTASPSPTATPTAKATNTPPATATPKATAPASDADPSLAQMNAAGNHTMGSTIPSSDSAAPATGAAKPKALFQAQAAALPPGLPGLDVSAYQPTINWASVAANGARFAYVKATEGTTYSSRTFASQYNGAYAAGLTRGAYHFATPNTSSGTAQANYFVANGGGWSNDGKTLPPLLDIEYGYNATCWGLSQASMVAWIRDFTNRVKALTGIQPAIYSTTDWWTQCTGNSSAFAANPLFIARYTTASTPGTLPASWNSYSLWQWADSGTFPGDQDVFNGTAAALLTLAQGGLGSPIGTAPAGPAATLNTGATLSKGQSITSSNNQYTLTMQTDGNAVVYGNGRALWQTQTSGNAGAKLSMQADGNAVVYSAANKPIWASNTRGTGSNPKLIIQSGGDLQLTTASGMQWHNGAPGSDTLISGTTLTGGQLLHDSTGSLQAIMQTDGNFVVYLGGRAKWSSHTSGLPGSKLILQSDGNLVIYDKNGSPRWYTNTDGQGLGLTMRMQSDGNLVLYKGTKPLWWSNTSI